MQCFSRWVCPDFTVPLQLLSPRQDRFSLYQERMLTRHTLEKSESSGFPKLPVAFPREPPSNPLTAQQNWVPVFP